MAQQNQAQTAPTSTPAAQPAFFRVADLMARYGISRSVLYKRFNKGFPPPVHPFGPRLPMWSVGAVLAYEQKLQDAADSASTGTGEQANTEGVAQ